MDLLRFIACGSVDDGKSTLIGRILWETNSVPDDAREALERDTRRRDPTADAPDLSLLLDGLIVEREQGITVDVAYRHFSTARRRFLVADTPGHEQYTRNMVTGASTADAAVILVDAQQGVLRQTRRHSAVVALLGVRAVVLAVNKMDLVGFDQAVFDRITADYRLVAAELRIESVACIPVSARRGDNVTTRSRSTPWYDGPTLLGHLELIEPTVPSEESLRLPVQLINRTADFRGAAGTIARGRLTRGERVRLLPSGVSTTVARIATFDDDLEVAGAGQAVTLAFADDIDVARGDMVCGEADPAVVTNSLWADVVWMHAEPMVPGHRYLLKTSTQVVSCTFARPDYRLDMHTLERVDAAGLDLNDIGRCSVTTDRPVVVDRYADNRHTGGFIVIDRVSGMTLAAGMVAESRVSDDAHGRAVVPVDREDRWLLNRHGSCVVWFTGMSGAGKTTIARLVERALHDRGVRTFLLDGDELRAGLSSDLGFSPEDRAENIRRAGEVAKLMADAGLVVLACFISPYASDRERVRGLFADGEFIEVFVDAPLDVLAARDTKGLYAAAQAGTVADLTGVSAPYEAPIQPQIRLDTVALSPEESARRVVEHLAIRGVVPPQ